MTNYHFCAIRDLVTMKSAFSVWVAFYHYYTHNKYGGAKMNANKNSNHLPLPKYQSTIEDVLKFRIKERERYGFQPLRYVIFDGDLDSNRPFIQADHLADAVTTTLKIVQSKRENRTTSDYHIYSVSLWQVHENGTFHRVGYAEDRQTFEDMKLGLSEKLNAAIWRGIDNAMASLLAHYIFD